MCYNTSQKVTFHWNQQKKTLHVATSLLAQEKPNRRHGKQDGLMEMVIQFARFPHLFERAQREGKCKGFL